MLKIFIFICKRQKHQTIIEVKRTLNILIINFGSTQEVLSLTPFFKILNEYIDCKISILVKENSVDPLNNNPFINSIIIWEHKLFNNIKIILNQYSTNYDVIIDSDEITISRYSHLLTALINSKYKIGFIGVYDNLLTHRISRHPINSVHLIDRYLKLIEPFGIKLTTSNLNIVYNTNAETKSDIETFLIKNDMHYQFKFLLNISSEKNIGTWNEDNYRRLLRYLKNYSISIIIGTSIQDYEIAKNLSEGRYKIFVNDIFDQYAEIIRNSNFIFSPDSFSVQLAGAYEKPIFCLFVQHQSIEMINVPYKSDFDFVLTDKPKLSDISYGKVLNSFVPYFDHIYENYQIQQNNSKQNI